MSEYARKREPFMKSPYYKNLKQQSALVKTIIDALESYETYRGGYSYEDERNEEGKNQIKDVMALLKNEEPEIAEIRHRKSPEVKLFEMVKEKEYLKPKLKGI